MASRLAARLRNFGRRSPAELRYRLRQELGNLWLLAARPDLPVGAVPDPPLSSLPDVAPTLERLRGTPYAREVERLADQIVAHHFHLAGRSVETGSDIRWRRDYVHDIESPLSYYRLIRYLDLNRAGDHKLIWELNRHQHLVLLAQAFRLTERRAFLDEIVAQLKSWFVGNPSHRGINWASALEVAFRSLSWMWVYHLAGPFMDTSFRRRFLSELYRHGLHIERNLSIYFSPNTHLLGEAVALHALGVSFPAFPAASRWALDGAALVQQQMESQVLDDGVHFERSNYYHLYALDMFLFHHLLLTRANSAAPEWFSTKLRRMAEHLDAVMGKERMLDLVGDDDGGRLFHPYGAPDRFGRDTLATCALSLADKDWPYAPEDIHPQAAWWMGEAAFQPPSARVRGRRSVLFPDAGLAVFESEQAHILIDAGPFGPWGAGHSHSDTLSFVARFGSGQVLIDPGTFTYVAGAEWRDRFRGSTMHNTVRVDGQDQATPGGPFRWLNKPEVVLTQCILGETEDYLDASVRYAGFIHRRRFLFRKPDLLFILDQVNGPPGEHLIEQFWHLGMTSSPLPESGAQVGPHARLIVTAGPRLEWIESGEIGWRSPVFGRKEPAQVLRLWMRGVLPVTLGSLLELSEKPAAVALCSDHDDGAVVLSSAEPRGFTARFPDDGRPPMQPSG